MFARDEVAKKVPESEIKQVASTDASGLSEEERSKISENVKKLSRKEFIELVESVRINNWVLLSKMYPKRIRPQNTTFAYVVNEQDQIWRRKVAIVSLLIFVVSGLVMDLNRSNLHGVYRDQLAGTWLTNENAKLADMKTCEKGGPLQLIHCTHNRMGTRSDPDPEQQSRFTFSSLYCGTNKIGFRKTATYHEDETLADAIAISGAAVSPINSPECWPRYCCFSQTLDSDSGLLVRPH